MPNKISPKQVRYIKLGRGGMWEAECVENGIVRFGFGSANRDRFPLCHAGKWGELTKSFLASARDRGTATRFPNETRLFFEDRGSTLWLTFVGERLCWGLLTKDPAMRHEDGDGVFRSVAGGWRWRDLSGEILTKDRLSAGLTE